MRWDTTGGDAIDEVVPSIDSIVLKVTYAAFLLAGLAALSVAPEVVIRVLPYPGVVLGLAALVVGAITVAIPSRRLHS